MEVQMSDTPIEEMKVESASSGLTGPAGERGPRGFDGAIGLPGLDGQNGSDDPATQTVVITCNTGG